MSTAVCGLIFLTVLALQPQPGTEGYGLLFPPWVSKAEAFSRAAALERAIIDIRLSGRLIVLNAAPPLAPLSQGALVINQGAAALCFATLPSEEPAS